MEYSFIHGTRVTTQNVTKKKYSFRKNQLSEPQPVSSRLSQRTRNAQGDGFGILATGQNL